MNNQDIQLLEKYIIGDISSKDKKIVEERLINEKEFKKEYEEMVIAQKAIIHFQDIEAKREYLNNIISRQKNKSWLINIIISNFYNSVKNIFSQQKRIKQLSIAAISFIILIGVIMIMPQKQSSLFKPIGNSPVPAGNDMGGGSSDEISNTEDKLNVKKDSMFNTYDKTQKELEKVIK